MEGSELIYYSDILQRLKEKIKYSRQKAVLAVNNELLSVYWEVGNSIAQQEQLAGWGKKIVDRLSADLKSEFPDMKGFSPRNLRLMRDFALAFPSFLQQPAAISQVAHNESVIILQQVAAKLPWGHYQVILTKLKNLDERTFYIQKAVENNWSRSILEHQIDCGLFNAKGKLVNNFDNTLSLHQSELTTQLFKDPYNFDFIMLGERAKEKDLEDALITNVTKVLLELGNGFAFMGRQKRFTINERDYFVDLLFYHTKLRRHIIIELKVGEFEAEYVGKMNLYLGLADDQLKGEFDESAIGLILCKTNDKIIAEYALRDTTKPIGIAEYKIAERLPENIKGELPSIEEIEQRMDEESKENQNPVDARIQIIKNKIKQKNVEELQTKVTFDLLHRLYQNSLRLLYTELIDKVKVFEENFFAIRFLWFCTGHNLNDLDAVDSFWQREENLKNILEFKFEIKLDGFKKADSEFNSSWFDLTFKISTYHYLFSSANINNPQPFLKKMYHQPLTPEDRQNIISLAMTSIMDDIERLLNRTD